MIYMEDDFINIETKEYNGKPVIKFDDIYIDSLNGKCIEYISDESSYQLSDSSDDNSDNDIGNNNDNTENNNNNDNGDCDLDILQSPKPEMVASQDNTIIINMKNFVIQNKSLYCLDIGAIPILIFDINHFFLNDFPMELKFDYTQHILTWMNQTFYNKLYNKNRINVTNAVYRNIIIEYTLLMDSPILPDNESTIRPVDIDTFVDDFLKKDCLHFIHNVFQLIIALMKIINQFQLNSFQKKLYVIHVTNLLSKRDIFSNELECLIMKKGSYLYSTFIDVILDENKRIIQNYEAKAASSCNCLNTLRNLFCLPKYY